MLFGKHASGEGVGIIAGHDRHARLAQHLAGVELLGDDMDRASGLCIASVDCALVRVEALVQRQERGVNINYAFGK